MNSGTWSLDTDSKRWLAVLSAACLVSVAMLAHAFTKALAPTEENSVTVQKPAPAAATKERTRSEPAWGNSPQIASPQIAANENHEVTTDRVSPFDSKNKLRTKVDDLAAEKAMVHEQADYLRKLIAEGRLPASLGKLTKERVDEMEKNGITIQ
jgi:hypothetical protein